VASRDRPVAGVEEQGLRMVGTPGIYLPGEARQVGQRLVQIVGVEDGQLDLGRRRGQSREQDEEQAVSQRVQHGDLRSLAITPPASAGPCD